MLTDLEVQIIAILQSIFDRAGWLGVACLMAVESATGFSPGEVIMGLAGWMLLAAHRQPQVMIFVAGVYITLGSLVGTSVTYWSARLGGRPLVERVARRLRLNPGLLTYAENSFRKWGPGLVCFGRVVPGIRVFISVPAGLAQMPFLRFLLYSFIGIYVWSTSIIAVGYYIGHRWYQVAEVVGDLIPFFFAALVLLALLGWAARRYLLRRLLVQQVVAVGDAGERAQPR